MQERRLFTDERAAMNKCRSGSKFMPETGTERWLFEVKWCQTCKRCPDPNQDDPKECDIRFTIEWQYDTDGQPICTAFVEREE